MQPQNTATTLKREIKTPFLSMDDLPSPSRIFELTDSVLLMYVCPYSPALDDGYDINKNLSGINLKIFHVFNIS